MRKAQSLHCIRIAALLTIAILTSTTRAQTSWTDPATGPVVIQNGFGDYGQNMPGNGEDYCQPTSAVMSILWLQQNGFTQLGLGTTPFTNQNTPQVENLERLIAGLMDTSATGGTYESSADQGLENYFDAAGLSGLYSYIDATTGTNNFAPSISWLQSQLAKNNGSNPAAITFVNYGITWYYQSGTGNNYYSDGGHEMDLLSVTGTDTTGTITIHNPEPSTLYNVLDRPQNSFQYVGLQQVPSNWILHGESLPSSDYLQLETPTVGTEGDNTYAVMDSAYSWTIQTTALPTSGSYAIQTWALNAASTAINTNGATFNVIAPITDGTSVHAGFDKSGLGAMVLQNSDATTGVNTLEAGTLESTYTGGALFGTGSATLEGNSTLAFSPSGSGATVSLSLATGSGATVNVSDGGAILAVNDGNYLTSSLLIGGNTDGTTPNISLTSNATLVIAVSSGKAGLGTTDTVTVSGSGGNLPTNNAYNMVTPSIVGQDNDPNESGYFLNYNTITGFQASGLLGNSINAGSGQIVDIATNQTVSAEGSAVGALQVEEATVSGGELTVGTGSSGDITGIILNGGSVTASINIGAAQADIYTSLEGGLISSNLAGSGGLVTFGPGNLTMSGNNASTLSGSVFVNSGTLTNAGNQSTGSGTVTVSSAAALQVNLGATVGGDVYIKSNGTLILSGGTIAGHLSTDPTGTESAATGGIVQGFGTIVQSATIASIIEPGTTMGTLTFLSNANLSNALYYWNLADLTSNATGTAGTDWNLTSFESSANLENISIFVQFSTGVDDPNSNNAFWNTEEEWTLWQFAGSDWDSSGRSVENGTFADGSFDTIDNLTNDSVILQFIPVPEPDTTLLIITGLTFAFIMVVRRRIST